MLEDTNSQKEDRRKRGKKEKNKTKNMQKYPNLNKYIVKKIHEIA